MERHYKRKRLKINERMCKDCYQSFSNMWGKKQFTPEEVRQSRKISVARSHAERAIKYIKDYHVSLKIIS